MLHGKFKPYPAKEVMVKKSYLKRINCLLVNLTRFQLNFPKYDLALKKKKINVKSGGFNLFYNLFR